MILPHINEIAAICAGHGITHAILSPGSRSAAISLAFDQHPEIETHMVTDERSAAFTAMGMAQIQKRPVALICTSGSASLNYAPAIAEAYYQEIPLLVITADRPPEWIDQYDGQTINQTNIYGKHVKASFDLPVDASYPDAKWHSNRLVNEAIISASQRVFGPVHLNVPIREPFYPTGNEKIKYEQETRLIKPIQTQRTPSQETLESLAHDWNNARSRWIIVGQHKKDELLTKQLSQLSDSAAIINEITGNQHQLQHNIQNQEAIFAPSRNGHIEAPELLITIGNSLISKSLKLYLRKNKPQNHWHIKDTDRINDSLQSLTKTISIEPHQFFEKLNPLIKKDIFSDVLKPSDDAFEKKKKTFFENCEFGEFMTVERVMKSLPTNVNLHLANSMSVRYANFVGGLKNDIEVFCNRGTSGIDGSNSTALGAAKASKKLNVLITGDLAFFYDRNAFWQQDLPKNLRIVILNNDGGGIFNMIAGPREQKNQEKLFLTPHGLRAEHLAKEFNLGYAACKHEAELMNALAHFYQDAGQPQIIEVFSDIERNTKVLEAFKAL